MRVDNLLEINQFENTLIEYKRILDRAKPMTWLKTVAGFANTHGGRLILGVNDETLDLIGYDKKDAENERNYFNNLVNQTLSPRPATTIKFIDYVVREKKRFIIDIHIEESMVKPVVLTNNGIPSIFVRRDGYTNGATSEEIVTMAINSSRISFDRLTTDIEFNINDFSILSNFYKQHNPNKQLSTKALQSIGFFDENNHITKGAQLFSDAYKDGLTKIMCSSFSGFSKGSERLVTVKTINTNICDSIDQAYEFITQRMNQTIVKLDTSHEIIDAFPKRAIFEGIINAIAHRDYYLNGTQINLDLFKDRLEISSPGSFYQHNPLEKTYDLTKVISNRRDQLICDVLVKCNVMEAAGTGFDKIIDEYKNADSKHRPYVYSTSNHFTLVLPDLTFLDGIVDPIVDQLPPISNPSKYDVSILSFCKNKERRSKEIADYLQISNSTYFRNTILQNLVDQNLLDKETNGKTNYYRSNL